MSRIAALATIPLVLWLSTGCHHHAPVQAEHLDDHGLHVVSTPQGRSVAWITDKGARLCSTQGGGMPAGHPPMRRGPGAGPGPGAAAGSGLDTLLFRLCEARGNGDISAEQYAAAVQALTATMQKAVEAHAAMGGMGPMGAMGRGHSMGHGASHGKHGPPPGKGHGAGKTCDDCGDCEACDDCTDCDECEGCEECDECEGCEDDGKGHDECPDCKGKPPPHAALPLGHHGGA